MVSNEKYDEFRSVKIQIKTWYYHKDYPDNHEQEQTNWYPHEDDGPFANTRYEWFMDAAETITQRMIEAMIDEFSDRGISDPPGRNTGSIDWDYEVIETKKKVKSGEPRIPSDVLANIQVILRKINENRDDVDYVSELKSELDRILSRNDLSREDIKDLIRSAGVEDIL